MALSTTIHNINMNIIAEYRHCTETNTYLLNFAAGARVLRVSQMNGWLLSNGYSVNPQSKQILSLS